jgi:hypothetical protein
MMGGRTWLTAVAACTLALSLGGCESLSDFSIDPTEWISGDFFSSKKKLQGERKPVFPEGVPGVSRGIPPELVKGYQASDGEQDDTARQAANEQSKTKPKPKAKPAPKVAAKPTTAEPSSRPASITVRRPDPTAAQQQQPPTDQWPDPTLQGQQQPGAAQLPDPRSGSVGSRWPDPPPSR